MKNQEEEYQCSECGNTVKSDATFCPNCGSSLEDSSEEDQLVKIPIPSNPSDLSAIQSLLEENKIEYSINNNSMDSVFGLPMGRPLTLWVHKDQIDLANEIINSFFEQENVQILDTEAFEGNDNEEQKDPLIGVHGWLLVFCVSLIFLNPIINFLSFMPYFMKENYFSKIYPFLKLVNSIDIILSLMLLIFGIYIGITIWMVRPNAIKSANVFLNLLLGYVIIFPLLTLLIYYTRDINFNTTMVGFIADIFRENIYTIIYVISWKLYLKNSIRVKNTFSSVN